MYVTATVGVIVGVYWEGDRFSKEKQQRGWLLLVGSLAVDTLFTILVFGADGWINTIQRGEIIALEARLAPRSLLPKQQEEIASDLKNLPKLAFAFSILPEPEPTRLMLDIGNTLAAAGWTWINFPVASGRGGAGFGYSVRGKPTIGTNFSLTDVSIWVPAAHNVDWSAPVITLQNALNSVPGIKATAFVDQPGTEPIIDGVVIWVGGKP